MKNYCILSLLLLLMSCLYNHTNNINELGNGYFFLGDGNESQILLDISEKGKPKMGKIIIPQTVRELAFDSNFIFAIQVLQSPQEKKYWLINKSNGVIAEKDSVKFHVFLNKCNLNLKYY